MTKTCFVYWDDLSYQLSNPDSSFSIINIEGSPYKITWDNSQEHIIINPDNFNYEIIQNITCKQYIIQGFVTQTTEPNSGVCTNVVPVWTSVDTSVFLDIPAWIYKPKIVEVIYLLYPSCTGFLNTSFYGRINIKLNFYYANCTTEYSTIYQLKHKVYPFSSFFWSKCFFFFKVSSMKRGQKMR
jgi:hypothetical protein